MLLSDHLKFQFWLICWQNNASAVSTKMLATKRNFQSLRTHLLIFFIPEITY